MAFEDSMQSETNAAEAEEQGQCMPEVTNKPRELQPCLPSSRKSWVTRKNLMSGYNLG